MLCSTAASRGSAVSTVVFDNRRLFASVRLMRTIHHCFARTPRNTILVVTLLALGCLAGLSSCEKPNGSATTDAAQPGSDYELGNVISFGEGGGSEKYKTSGWSDPEKEFTWTTGTSAKLSFKISKTNHPLKLHTRLSGFVNPPELPSQPVEVLVNGQKVADWQVSSPAEFTATIPAAAANTGELSVEIKTPKGASPQSLNISDDSRVLGINCFELTLSKADE